MFCVIAANPPPKIQLLLRRRGVNMLQRGGEPPSKNSVVAVAEGGQPLPRCCCEALTPLGLDSRFARSEVAVVAPRNGFSCQLYRRRSFGGRSTGCSSHCSHLPRQIYSGKQQARMQRKTDGRWPTASELLAIKERTQRTIQIEDFPLNFDCFRAIPTSQLSVSPSVLDHSFG
jgi:hypothetical protein